MAEIAPSIPISTSVRVLFDVLLIKSFFPKVRRSKYCQQMQKRAALLIGLFMNIKKSPEK